MSPRATNRFTNAPLDVFQIETSRVGHDRVTAKAPVSLSFNWSKDPFNDSWVDLPVFRSRNDISVQLSAASLSLRAMAICSGAAAMLVTGAP